MGGSIIKDEHKVLPLQIRNQPYPVLRDNLNC